jgi:DNA-directed RNA polymerase subunit RPC12/RpoP
MIVKPGDAERGIVRTNAHCTECQKTFIAELNFDIEGNHIIICPHCGHEHCRTIKNGIITEDRWDTKQHNPNMIYARSWKHSVLNIKTSTACNYIRERWLSFGTET